MKRVLKIFLYSLLSLIGLLIILGLLLAFLPTARKTDHNGIPAEVAATLRKNFKGPHGQFTTTDGETLFLWRWNPDTIVAAKKDIAVLLLHGITAYGGAYTMAGAPISKGGYTVFGLDYRGHGLSGGNRGDTPGKDRWITDLAEAVRYVKTQGFSKVVVLGHSLGVASTFCVANKIPDEIAGLIMLSGAYEGRKGVSTQPTLMDKARFLSTAIFRPSYQSFEYYRKGMTVTKDSLFNFRYTPRFLTMMDVKELRIQKDMNIPILVGAGDQDELFEVGKVKELYDLIPGNKKEFLVMKNSLHAKIPVEVWEEIVAWMDRSFAQ